MSRLFPYWLTYAILGILSVFINLVNVRLGGEFDGLTEYFRCITVFMSHTIAYFLLSTGSRNFLGKYYQVFQLTLVIVFSGIIFSKCHSICYPKSLSKKEQNEIKEKRLADLEKIALSIPERIKEEEVFQPSKDTLFKDKESIRTAFLNLARQSYDSLDLESRKKYINLTDCWITNLNQKETKVYLDAVVRSAEIMEIFYSPDKNKMLVFLGFNTEHLRNGIVEHGGDGIVLLGKREGDRISVFKYYHYQYPDLPNKRLAFADLFNSFSDENGKGNISCDSFLKESFWKCERWFKPMKFKGGFIYKFESRYDESGKKWIKIDPVFLISY